MQPLFCIRVFTISDLHLRFRYGAFQRAGFCTYFCGDVACGGWGDRVNLVAKDREEVILKHT